MFAITVIAIILSIQRGAADKDWLKNIIGPAILAPRLNITIRTDNKDVFEVGTPRVLACIVVGCAASLNITWYLGDVMLKPNVYKEVNRGNFTVSSLTLVPSITDNGKELVCRATNGQLSPIFEDRVTISVGQTTPTPDYDYNLLDRHYPEDAPPVDVYNSEAKYSVEETAIGSILLVAVCITSYVLYKTKCCRKVWPENDPNYNVNHHNFDVIAMSELDNRDETLLQGRSKTLPVESSSPSHAIPIHRYEYCI